MTARGRAAGRRWHDLPATLLRVSFAETLAYRSEVFVWLLTTNMPLIMLLLWTTVAAEAPVGPYGQREFVAYFLTTLVVRLLTGAWVVWEMNTEIRDGTLAMRLVRPVHPFLLYAAENVSAWPLRLVVIVPIAGIAVWLTGAQSFSHEPAQWLVFVLSVAGAWALSFFAMLSIGCLAFFWQSSLGVFEVWFRLYTVLSGYIVPLDLFPPWLRAVLDYLPFRYLLFFPVQTALGKVTLHASIVDLARQWIFVALFFALARVLWKRGVRRYEAFGG